MRAGHSHMVHHLGNSEELLGREKIGQKLPQMMPKKEFFLLFSLSEIGSSSGVVFPKVSSRVDSTGLGLFAKQDGGFRPHVQGLGRRSSDLADPALWHVCYIIYCALRVPRFCCFCTKRTALWSGPCP